nr:hypothetical protein BaRGS_006109 [Batillaria attramentaria]
MKKPAQIFDHSRDTNSRPDIKSNALPFGHPDSPGPYPFHFRYTVKTYHESDEHVENPHRGIINLYDTHASSHSPLSDASDASKDVVLQHVEQLRPIFHEYERIITAVQAGFIGAWGHHNDCFLASDSDSGTYHNKATEYPYLAEDTRYVIMGGETCAVTNNHRHECPTALKELAMFHWTFLNQGWNPAVYNVWKHQGCFEEVHRRLGYRLVLKKAILPDTVRTNDNLCFHLEFTNTGFAAPAKVFDVFFILQSSSG